MAQAKHQSALSRPFRVDAKVALPARVEFAATDAECAALAAEFGAEAVSRVAAAFTVDRASRGRIHVTGAVDADMIRECVVSLEPFEATMHEPVDLYFAPVADERSGPATAARGEAHLRLDEDPPEPLINGVIDLGDIAREHLALGLDPYPRKPGVAFEASDNAEPPAPSPFAVLRVRAPAAGKDKP